MTLNTNEIVGRNLKMCRTNLGMRQSDLAVALGVAQTVVSSAERGERAWRITDIQRFSDALDVEPWVLLDGVVGMPKPLSATPHYITVTLDTATMTWNVYEDDRL
jgi:transcriptional regulator with XRE-family HTH domain